MKFVVMLTSWIKARTIHDPKNGEIVQDTTKQ